MSSLNLPYITNDESACGLLADVLRRQTTHLQALHSQLWAQRASHFEGWSYGGEIVARQMACSLNGLRREDLFRAMLTAGISIYLLLPGEPSLDEITAAVRQPWKTLFATMRLELVGLIAQIDELHVEVSDLTGTQPDGQLTPTSVRTFVGSTTTDQNVTRPR